MLVNKSFLVQAEPLHPLYEEKRVLNGVSYGLSEVGYDLRIKQKVEYFPPSIKTIFKYGLKKGWCGFTRVTNKEFIPKTQNPNNPKPHKEIITITERLGNCALASSIERFTIPDHLWGELRNKSSHARKFFDASLGTDMEPGWKGHLTIEIVFHDRYSYALIKEGSGILKAVFHEIKERASYDGKYQNQADKPIEAIMAVGNI